MKNATKFILLTLLVLNSTFGITGSVVVKQRKILSSTGSDHSELYLQTNKIVTANGKTHISWIEGDFDVKIKAFNHSNNTWETTVKYGTAYDDHGGPALLIDGTGFLHTFFGPHNGIFNYRVSLHAWDSSEWSATTYMGSNATYPSVVADHNGTIHIAYRGHTNPRKLIYQYKLKESSNWQAPVEAVTPVSGITGDPYTNYQHSLTVSENGELHLLFSIYYDSKLCYVGQKSRFVGYLKKNLLGDEPGEWIYSNPWETIYGSSVALPVTKDTIGGVILKAADTTSDLDFGVTGISLDSNGKPWFVLREQIVDATGCINPEDWTQGYNYNYGARNYYLYHHNGTSLESTNITDLFPLSIQDAAFSSDPSITIDAHNNLYIAGILRTFVGGVSHYGVAVLYNNLDSSSTTYDYLEVTPPMEQTVRAYSSVNIERPTNQNRIGFPWLIFSYDNEHVEAAQLGGQ